MELETIIRPGDMRQYMGQALSSTYADAKSGLLTPPVKIGRRASGWLASEVQAIQRARIRGDSEEQIRALVQDLLAKRQAEPALAQ